MRILIHDTNILIDLISIGLLDTAMQLPCLMETTDLVQHEVSDPEQARRLSACIGRRLLAIITSPPDQLATMAMLMREHPGLSLADCSILAHAQDRGCIVVSGDRLLRLAARQRKLEVHGTLWLFDFMVDEGLIHASEAVQKLELLMRINTRLPNRECRAALDRWKQTM
jgi:predicted nucleic acid-binding protein